MSEAFGSNHSMLMWLRVKAPKGQFVRQALTIMLGSSAAQLISIAASPAIARLYSPSDFGLFALYASLLAMASSVATGRYDVAVVLSKDDVECNQLAVGSMVICTSISFLMLLTMLPLSQELANLLQAPTLAPWLKFLPLGTFLAGICSTLSFFCNRHANYQALARSRVIQALGTSSMSIIIGFLWPAGGLYVSSLLGYLLAAMALMHVVKYKRIVVNLHSASDVVGALWRYRNFPFFSVPTDLISQLSGQLPRFFMGIYFGNAALGLFFLNQRVLDLPLGVIAGSVREVFSREASQQYQREQGCRDLFMKTFRHLVLMSLLPSVAIFILAPDAFALVFGERWREAGEYSKIMVPMYFLRFCISPLCMMFYIAQKQHQELIWQLILLILTCLSFAIGVSADDAKLGLSCYSAMYCLMYVLIFFMAFSLSKGSREKNNDVLDLKNKI